MIEGRMTKGERDDLIRLIKQRERVGKSAAKQRSAEMLAEFERKISVLHAFDDNEVWSAALKAGSNAVAEANQKIDAEAARLGIPQEFRPKINASWARRGENEYRQRRDELRRVAKAEIETFETAACVEIESRSVEAQTQVIATGLQSSTAIEFLSKLPSLEDMMPTLTIEAIQTKALEKARAKRGYQGPHLIKD